MHSGPSGGGEFADTVNAIVRVGAEDVCTVLGEGERFSDEFERAGRVRRKDDCVSRRGAEEV